VQLAWQLPLVLFGKSASPFFTIAFTLLIPMLMLGLGKRSLPSMRFWTCKSLSASRDSVEEVRVRRRTQTILGGTIFAWELLSRRAARYRQPKSAN
jgi:hypothetical protein